MTFYSQKYIRRLHSIDEAKVFLEKAGDERPYVFIREKYLNLLRSRLQTPLFILSEREGFLFPGKILLVSSRPQKGEESQK